MTKRFQPSNAVGYELLALSWYRNGGWNNRYHSGERLFYVYLTLVLCNREAEWLIKF